MNLVEFLPFLSILGLFAVQPRISATAHIRSPVFCYQCNTLENSKCAGNDLTEFFKPCNTRIISGREVRNPIGCRVLYQKVPMVNAHIPGYSELIVTVRECAYNMNFDKTKFDASSGIRYSAQQCRNSVDGNPCNGAGHQAWFRLLWIGLILFSLL